MSTIRCIYHGQAPAFPATDQHPHAKRYGPIATPDGAVFVDAIGGAPSVEEIDAVLHPPAAPEPDMAEKLAAAGISVSELKQALGLEAAKATRKRGG
jgi:hypothetical protein